MDITLRTPTDADWEAILGLAFAAVPWDTAGNREWLDNRRHYSDGRRRHYLAEEHQRVVGYGAIEEGPEAGVFRMFVVMSAEDVERGIGDVVFERLMTDLNDLDARGIWAREYADEKVIVPFFLAHGFTENTRFTLEGEAEMIVLVRVLEA